MVPETLLEEEPGEGVEIENLEVAGVIVEYLEDSLGNRWAVPADNVDEPGDYNPRNPLDFPNKDPRFDYQWVRDEQLPVYLASG